MKTVVLPIVLAIVLAVLARVLNPQIQAAGIIIAGAFGLGIGAVINNFVLKRKKSEEESD
jgi:general stress protein CsbA